MHDIEKLLDDAEACGRSSLLTLMGVKGANSSKEVGMDIPAAAELYALLRQSLAAMPRFFDYGYLDGNSHLKDGIYHCIAEDSTKLVLVLSVAEQTLEYVAYWISQNVESDKLLAMPGSLVIPFSIEKYDERFIIIPEWFVLFYVDNQPEHCVPLLALKSVISDNRFSDWVSVAFSRAEIFKLPISQAKAAAEQVKIEKSNN